MKIADIDKDYHKFIDDLINKTKDEVFTLKEIFNLCEAQGYKCTYDGMRSYIRRTYPSIKIYNNTYFGKQILINELKKREKAIE